MEKGIEENKKKTVNLVTFKTEDGHTKTDCPVCEGAEHVEHILEFGECLTCRAENRHKE